MIYWMMLGTGVVAWIALFAWLESRGRRQAMSEASRRVMAKRFEGEGIRAQVRS